jgi:hypothetical protein
MKTLVSVFVALCLAGFAQAQNTDGLVVVTGKVVAQDTPTVVSGAVAMPQMAFVAPPVLAVPSLTSDVLVVETVVTTNIVTTLTTNRVERRAQVVTTNATLRRFVIDIDTNQVPTRFTSYMSDGSVVVTAAGNVGSMTNRVALSTFNGLLRDVIGSGRRNVNTNAMGRAGGTNAVVRLQRVWSASGAMK